MRKVLATICASLTLLLAESTASAQNMIWSGWVNSRGAQTNGPVLAGNQRYVIRVSGSVYFGRWWRNGRPLNDDACYEYTAKGAPDPLPVFRNSYGVPVCDGQYRASHVYQSAAFLGRNAPISFSIFDTDYRDNSGAMRIEILDVGSAAGPGPGVAGDQYCRDLYARGDAANRAGNAARDRGDIAGARARYQQALALFRQGAADPRCARYRGQFENAAGIAQRNLQRVAGAMPPTPPPGGGYLGCFRDQGDPGGTRGRDLNGFTTGSQAMTPALCVQTCAARGFAFAGAQYGRQCFCGNSYGRSGFAANCNMRCAGNAAQICGGVWANSVYRAR